MAAFEVGLSQDNMTSLGAPLSDADDIFRNNLGVYTRSRVYGGGGDDTLYGSRGDDTFYGGEGDDTLLGNDGRDRLLGGSGNDVIFGGGATYGDDGPVFGDSDDDRIEGGAGNDTLIGGDDNDTINGGDGNDVLDGGKRNDVLSGGAGDDVMSGGEGDDRFEFVARDGPAFPESFGDDTITDFNHSFGSDALAFDRDLAAMLTGGSTDVRDLKDALLGRLAATEAGTVIDLGEAGSILLEDRGIDRVARDLGNSGSVVVFDDFT